MWSGPTRGPDESAFDEAHDSVDCIAVMCTIARYGIHEACRDGSEQSRVYVALTLVNLAGADAEGDQVIEERPVSSGSVVCNCRSDGCVTSGINSARAEELREGWIFVVQVMGTLENCP